MCAGAICLLPNRIPLIYFVGKFEHLVVPSWYHHNGQLATELNVKTDSSNESHESPHHDDSCLLKSILKKHNLVEIENI